MLYQRKIPRSELLASKLGLQLEHGRHALVGAKTVGVAAVCALSWYQVNQMELLAWAVAMLLLSFFQSLRMSSAFGSERYRQHPNRVLFGLIFFALLAGASWSGSVVWFDQLLSDQVFYILILIVTIISVITVALTSVIREVYLALLLSTLVPTASWLGWQFADRPFNLMLAVMLTALALLMALISGSMSRVFSEMVESSLELEAMTQDFAELSESLRLRNNQLQEARKQLAEIATIDELTGLNNRRGASQIFETEISRAKRSGASLAVIMLDVDHFKLYNDTYGHPAGDDVLRKIADVLQSTTARAGEVAVRMGGEEFMVVLPGATQGDALGTAEVIKRRIADLEIPHKTSLTAEHVTISQGVVACIPKIDTEISELVEAADKALYTSKESGRNTVSLSPFSP